MDIVAVRGRESIGGELSRVPDGSTSLVVTATYDLSEAGRKALLLAGGDGKARQQLTLHVPASRLHLVAVDREGVARLRLQPRFVLQDDGRVARVEQGAEYDAPPTVDELLRAAARNLELEGAYVAERVAVRAKRRESADQWRAQAAEAFLADPAKRAQVHPPPTTRRCCLVADRGRVFFDTTVDGAAAQAVVQEAYRRFRADMRGRRERGLTQRAEQMAVHEEKKRFIAEWIASHGTPEQRERHASGVLPIAEAVEAMADVVFAPLSDLPRYEHDGVALLQAHVRARPEHSRVELGSHDLLVTTSPLPMATAEQWALVQRVRKALPEAAVTLRAHRLAWRGPHDVEPVFQITVLVASRLGPFVLRRDYEC